MDATFGAHVDLTTHVVANVRRTAEILGEGALVHDIQRNPSKWLVEYRGSWLPSTLIDSVTQAALVLRSMTLKRLVGAEDGAQAALEHVLGLGHRITRTLLGTNDQIVPIAASDATDEQVRADAEELIRQSLSLSESSVCAALGTPIFEELYELVRDSIPISARLRTGGPVWYSNIQRQIATEGVRIAFAENDRSKVFLSNQGGPRL